MNGIIEDAMLKKIKIYALTRTCNIAFNIAGCAHLKAGQHSYVTVHGVDGR